MAASFITDLKIQALVLVIAILLAGCQSKEGTATPVLDFTKIPEALSTATPTLTAMPSITPDSTSTPSPTTTITPSATQVPSATLMPTFVPGSTQISVPDRMLLHFVPAGEFLMGSSDQSPGADQDEKPQHLVYLNAFWVDQTEVTNAMYAEFLNVMGNQEEGNATWLDAADEDVLLVEANGFWQPKRGTADFPVIEVTWYGARAYCEWAGRRLPTEAEWEKAARGADARSYPWGEDRDCSKAQVANCHSVLTTVASKPGGVSPYGIFDMAGSVWEWVTDWYAQDYYAQSPEMNPLGPAEGIARSLRGGSYDYNWKHARTADRRLNGPANSMNDYGFRCVMDAVP